MSGIQGDNGDTGHAGQGGTGIQRKDVDVPDTRVGYKRTTRGFVLWIWRLVIIIEWDT